MNTLALPLFALYNIMPRLLMSYEIMLFHFICLLYCYLTMYMSNILDFKTLFQKHCTCNIYTLFMLDHVQVDIDISFSGQ